MQALDDHVNIEVHVRSPSWDPDLPRINQTWDPNSRKLLLVRFHYISWLRDIYHDSTEANTYFKFETSLA